MKDLLLGLILGTALGISGYKHYLLQKDDAVKYSQKELREKVTDISTMTCIEGMVNTIQYYYSRNQSMPNCKIIGQKWGDIYK